jgi:hypothetical protein
VDFADTTIDGGGNEGMRSEANTSSFTFTDCVVSNNGGSTGPLGDRDHGIRIRGNDSSLTVTGCLLTGNDSGVRFDSGAGQTGDITDTVIYFCGRATRVDDDHGGGGTFAYTNCTVHACGRGIETESNVPNTWDVQYCIFSDWDELSGFGFDNTNGTENVTDNNNVYADNDIANTARRNVTAGANTEDVPSAQAVYCSQSQPNPLFLHVGTNSAANDIDGVGGVAGSKPASCVTQSPMIVTDWAAY